MAASFADLLREKRVAASLTQEALAERCHLSPATIAALEQGRRRAPRLSTVGEIADALGLDAQDRASLAAAAGAARPREATSMPTAATTTRHGPWSGTGHWKPPPSPITPLIGRHAAVVDVAHQLETERLVTLVGPGGVGKTRLALSVALETAEAFPGGTCWVELGPEADGGAVPCVFLRAFGGSDQPAVDVHDQLGGLVPAERTLVVVDNCEHVLEGAALCVAALLRQPQLSVLATSRQPMGIPGEVTSVVPALEVPSPASSMGPSELGSVESVELFVERAHRVRPGFRLSGSNAEAIAQICRRLEGLPLAIELTAARVSTLEPRRLADEVGTRIPLTEARARGVPDRQSTLWASIDWSYQLLDPVEQSAFRCLAGFVGPISLDAFAGVAGLVTGESPQRSVDMLHDLANKSLVSFDPETDSYLALDSIRTYATQRADQAGELVRVKDGHADQVLSWLESLRAWEADDSALERLDHEYANFRAALVWSIESRSSRAVQLVSAFAVGWHQLSRHRDAVILGDPALDLAVDHDRPGWAKAVAALAMSRLLAGDALFVIEVIPAASAAAREAGDLLAEGWCRLVTGNRPPFDPAHLTDAYDLAISAGSPMLAGLAAASVVFGGTEVDSQQWLDRAFEHSKSGNASLRATSNLALADDLTERGRIDEALELSSATALSPLVMPGLRLIAIGQVMEVAFLRRDLALAEVAADLRRELGRMWPTGGWRFFAVGDLRVDWLRGMRPELTEENSLHWTTRMGITPVSMRAVCRAAVDRHEHLDISVVSKLAVEPTADSLMAASTLAVAGAQARLAGDPIEARRRWSEALRVAADRGYLLLACDALDALGVMACEEGRLELAATLLASGESRRKEVDYRFRFVVEQEAIDDAAARIRATAISGESLGFVDAVEVVAVWLEEGVRAAPAG